MLLASDSSHARISLVYFDLFDHGFILQSVPFIRLMVYCSYKQRYTLIWYQYQQERNDMISEDGERGFDETEVVSCCDGANNSTALQLAACE